MELLEYSVDMINCSALLGTPTVVEFLPSDTEQCYEGVILLTRYVH